MLTLQTRKVEPDIVVVEVAGRITIGRDCKQLEWKTAELLKEQARKVVFDLDQVTHVDSTGIGVIMFCAGQLKQAGGELRVASAKGHVQEVFKITNVDAIVAMDPTAAVAVEKFGSA